MSTCPNISHPILHQPGASQKKRLLDDLKPENIKIDGRSLADILDFIQKFSKQVNFYHKDLKISDWLVFFQNSIPFLIANIAKTDIKSMEASYQEVSDLSKLDPKSYHVQFQIDHLFREIIYPWQEWQLRLNKEDSGFGLILNNTLNSKLRLFLIRFIGLCVGAQRHFGTSKPDFGEFLNSEVWRLDLADLHVIDDTFNNVPGGIEEKITSLSEKLDSLFRGFLESLVEIVKQAGVTNVIEDSLISNTVTEQEKHPAHLGLLFVFLKLFKEVRGDLNLLSTKHLDFFYQQVLNINFKPARPDQAHVVFEVQKHISAYLLKKGRQLKDGKDLKKADIIFSLDNEIVVDKAQVKNLQSLFINHVHWNTGGELNPAAVEGLYMAPQSNTKDGIGKAFKDTESKNWNTLGAKESKLLLPASGQAVSHPPAGIGFMLASTVLLLKEGKRNIIITLDLDLKSIDCIDTPNIRIIPGVVNDVEDINNALQKQYYWITEDGFAEAQKLNLKEELVDTLTNLLAEKTPNKIEPAELDTLVDGGGAPIFNADLHEKFKNIFELKKAFEVSFSGEKEWVIPNDVTITFSGAGTHFSMKFSAVLEDDEPAIAFFDSSVLEEDYDTKLPVVKIELDDNLKIVRKSEAYTSPCCLEKGFAEKDIEVSFYHYFRHLCISSSDIKVDVCGVKNLVVQNDENLQDVNAPIYPFGVRPTIGSNFYVGSKEVLCKQWNGLRLNVNWKDKPASFKDHYLGYRDIFLGIGDILETAFQVDFSMLQDKDWKDDGEKNMFISEPIPAPNVLPTCPDAGNFQTNYEFLRGDFPALNPPDTFSDEDEIKDFNIASRSGFLRLTLKGQDFQHTRYPFVLARQMMAFGKLPEILYGAVYKDDLPPKIISIDELFEQVEESLEYTTEGKPKVDAIVNAMNAADDPGVAGNEFLELIEALMKEALGDNYPNPVPNAANLKPGDANFPKLGAKDIIGKLHAFLQQKVNANNAIKETGVVIPNQPYTPIISEISLDYTASASDEDINLIHLHPFEGTYEARDIASTPSLLPVITEEGTLFVGLENLTPGNNLHLLFQLAEATADSELDRAMVKWHYLKNNQWNNLREEFEVLSDDTKGLTRSGVVKIAIPDDISVENTIMPDDLYWIKASALKNTKAVAETLGVHTQAAKATFSMRKENDLARLNKPLEASGISKLLVADTSIKKIEQPYTSFSGKVPEQSGTFYRRVSEHLRHKGRAITAFDYEHLVMEQFEQVSRVKCINHTHGLPGNKYLLDFNMAPGFVLVAVVPDLEKLSTGNMIAPGMPVSLLEEIQEYLGRKNSPFVRLKVMNPRYEKVNIDVHVKLIKGKSEAFYTTQLEKELIAHLAPWTKGITDQLVFGRKITKSTIIKFIESRDYVDYICSIALWQDENPASRDASAIFPLTARSILTAGNMAVSSLDRPCEKYDQDGVPCNEVSVPNENLI